MHSPYGTPGGRSSPAARSFPAPQAAHAGDQHAGFPAAASPSMPPRFAEKQLPPEFLAGPSGLDDPSPSPPAHVARAATEQHVPTDAGYTTQQPSPAQKPAAREAEQGGAAFSGISEPRNGVVGVPVHPPNAAAQVAAHYSQRQPSDVAHERPAASVSEAPQQQEPQQQEQQQEYEIAPEHQFRIVSSDDESSDQDNSNSGTGY